MPSTTSPIEAGERQALGENLNSWGYPKLNDALTSLAETAAGRTTVAVGASNVTLDSTNFTPSIVGHYRYSLHVLTAGAGVGARNIVVPGVARAYRFANQTGFSQTVKTASGIGAVVRNGQTSIVHCDGTDCTVVDVTLDKVKAPVAAVDFASQKLTGVASGTLATDGVNLGQLAPYATTAARWATQTGSTVTDATTGVDSGDYSAKEYAIGTTVPAGSAKAWANAASGSASSASSSASAASTSAGNAATSATNAANSATAAANSASSVNLSNYALLAGTSDISITKASPAFSLDKAASGQSATFIGKKGGSNRWAANFGDATAESGGNVGSDFSLARYSDAGGLIDLPFSIARSSGVMALQQTPTVAGSSVWHTGNSPFSNASTGYQKFADGIMLQWGSTVIGLNGAGAGTIAFATSFPTGCRLVIVSNGDYSSNGNWTFAVASGAGAPTATAFTFGAFDGAGAATTGGTVRCNWLAVGY